MIVAVRSVVVCLVVVLWQCASSSPSASSTDGMSATVPCDAATRGLVYQATRGLVCAEGPLYLSARGSVSFCDEIVLGGTTDMSFVHGAILKSIASELKVDVAGVRVLSVLDVRVVLPVSGAREISDDADGEKFLSVYVVGGESSCMPRVTHLGDALLDVRDMDGRGRRFFLSAARRVGWRDAGALPAGRVTSSGWIAF